MKKVIATLMVIAAMVQSVCSAEGSAVALDIKKIEKMLNQKDCKNLGDIVSEKSGLAYLKIDEMGSATKASEWKYSRAEIIALLGAKKKAVCDVFGEAQKYIAKSKTPDIYETSVPTEKNVYWKVYEGRHAGNFRAFAVNLALEGNEWRVFAVYFPFDFTP